MKRTDTNYDRQFTESPVANNTYMSDTPSGIKPLNTSIISNPSPMPSSRPQAGANTINSDSYLQQLSLLEDLPMYAPESVEDKSVDPRIMQENWQSGGANWMDSLTSNIRRLMKSADIDRIAGLENEIYNNNKMLKDPNVTRDQIMNVQIANQTIQGQINEIAKKVENRDTNIEKNSPDLLYQIRAAQMQEDEATGMPGGSSEFNIFEGLGAYIGYEAPQDIAGSLTTAWAMAAAVAPQVLRSIGTKALAKAGIPIPGGRWVAAIWAAAELATIMGTQWKAREIETRMEAGSAYTDKLNKLITEYVSTTGEQPDDIALAELKAQAYQGIKSVKDANMMLWGEDVVQMALMAMPWTKTIRNAFSLSKYGAASASFVGLAAQGFGEAIEEGYQGNVIDDYNKGIIPDKIDLSYFWDTTTKTAKGIFGVTGDSEYMTTPEFRNAVRSGAAMGVMFGAGPTVIGAVDSVRKYSKDERLIKDLIELDIKTEKVKYRQAIYATSFNNGTQERTISILENIKGSKYAIENNITNEEVDIEIESAKKAFSLYQYVNQGELNTHLNPEEKQRVVSAMMDLSDNITKGKDTINENNEYIDNIYSTVDEVLSTKKPGFRKLNQLKNRVVAIQIKLDKIQESKDTALQNTSAYKKYLQVELSKAVIELEEGLSQSKIKESDLVLPHDDGIVHYELMNLDNEFQIKDSEEMYSLLSKPSKVKEFIEKSRENEEIKQDEAVKVEKEEAEALEKESALTRVKDINGNKYVYAGREGEQYTFLNQDTKQMETFSKEEVDEKGMVETTTGKSLTKDPTLLIDNNAEEYVYLGKYKNDHRIQSLETGEVKILNEEELVQLGVHDINNTTVDQWIPGSVIDLLSETNKDYAKFKEKLEEARGEIEIAVELFKERESEKIKEEVFSTDPLEDIKKFTENYGNPRLSNMSFSELFDSKNPQFELIPVLKNKSLGYLQWSKGGNISFTDTNGTMVLLGDINSNTQAVKDYGITVLKNFLFEFDLKAGANAFSDTITIEGLSYTLDDNNMMKGIKEDKENNPVSITLKRTSDNKKVTFTNKTIVEELAYALVLMNEARTEMASKLKNEGEDWIYVKDPESKIGKEYKVYDVAGQLTVTYNKDGKIGNEKELKSGKVYDRVLSQYRLDIDNAITAYEDIVDNLNERDELTKTNIRNEFEKIDNALRAATAEEVNNAKSAAELQDASKEKTSEDRQADEQEVEETKESKEEGKKDEDILILEKTDELAEERAEDLIEDKSEPIEVLELDEQPQEILNNETEYDGSADPETTTGVLDITTAVGWSENADKEFDDYVSNRELSVENFNGEYRIDYSSTEEVREWWDNHSELKKQIENGEDIDLTGKSDEIFDSIVDEIPIENVIKDGDSLTPGDTKFLHTSDYSNIYVPQNINEDKVGEYILEHKRYARAYRAKVLDTLLTGGKVTTSNYTRHKGVTNNEDANTKNRNKPLYKVWPDVKNWVIGIGTLANRIKKAQGKLMLNSKGKPFRGPTAAVFVETDQTLNGDKFALKVNSSKLSNKHAEILLSALITAYMPNSGGYSNVFEGPGVENMNVGEVITFLALEGEKFTRQETHEHPKPYLIEKQLYGKDNIIYYGESGEFDPTMYSDKDENDFIKWATTHKNYNVIAAGSSSLLGTKLKKNFKIGDIEGKKNQRYEDFLIFNDMILTDLKIKNPFHAPVISHDETTFETPNDIKNKKATEELKDKSKDTKKEIKVQKEKKTEVDNIEKEAKDSKEEAESKKNKKIEEARTKEGATEETISTEITEAEKENEDANAEINIEAADKEKEVNEKYKKELDKLNEEKKDIKLPPDYDVLNEVGKDNAPFRSTEWAKTPYKPTDIRKELKWLDDRFSGLDNQVVQDMIKMGDGLAFSTINDTGIILSQAAEEGSVYHEAFHWVSLGFLNDEQRSKIYNDAREEYNLGNMHENLIEEVLAEKFREYVLEENKYGYKSKTSIKGFFERVWAWLNSFWASTPKLGDLSIERLFETINNKEYKYYSKVNTIKGERARLQSRDFIKRKTGFTTDNIREWVSNIQFLTFDLNKVQNLEQVERIDFDIVKEHLESERDQYQAALESLDRSEDYMNEVARLVEVYEAVINNFSDFQKLVEDHLASLKIFKVDQQENFMDQFKASYESSAKDNMLSTIKMLIMTLPESQERTKFSNLYSFVEFDSFWNKLMYDLHNMNNITDMMDKMKSKFDTVFPYTVLYNKLKDSELLKTQFEISVKKTRHKFVNVLYSIVDGKPSFKFVNADVQKAVSGYINEWGQMFADSELFNTAGELSFEKINELIERYNEVLSKSEQYDSEGVIKEYDAIIEELVSMFNVLSIPMDVDTLNYIITDKKNIQSKSEGLNDFITNDIDYLFSDRSAIYKKAKNGKFVANKESIGNENLFKYESQIRKIAEAFTYSRPEDMTVTVLGPEGNPYHVYAQHSFITSTIRNINNDTGLDWVDNKLSAVFNKNSFILKQLKENEENRKKFDVETFSGFIRTNAKDAGRGYQNLSDTEDFLFKLAAVNEGKLPMPTFGDRKTYQFYTGIDILDYEFNTNSEGKLVVPLDSEVVDTFMGYAVDEYKRTLLVKKQIRDAIKNGDTSKLVANLHYQEAKDNEQAKEFEKVDRHIFKIFKTKQDKWAGNGTKFHYFKDFNNMKFSTNRDSLRKATKSFIRDNVRDTIMLAGELGIIDVHADQNGRPIITDNNLIDQALVDSVAKNEFNGNKTRAIYKILANFSVNTMMSKIETDKLFLGDPAFFVMDKTIKSTRKDQVKRSTALMSTGDEARSDFPAGNEFHGRDTFTSTTLATEKFTAIHYEEIKKKYIEMLEKNGYGAADAKYIAETKLAAYKGGIDPSDAQVFVTGDMWRELNIRYGTWDDTKQRAFDLLMSNKFLEPSQEETAMKVSLSILKLMYFGNSVENSLDIPEYDKMAIAPLFRRVTEGTDLDNLLDRMEATGKYKDMDRIDYVKFESAIKIGKREKHNYYANDDYTQLKDFTKEDLPTLQQDFSALKKQQVTEPHDVSNIPLGTQLKKIVMSNVDKTGTYDLNGEPIKGLELINTINDTMNKLSNIGKEKFVQQIGTDPESGRIGDPVKIANMLTRDGSKSGITDNALNALSIDETTDKPYMHSDALPNRKEIENRLISLITKETIDLNLPGNAFIQMTNFGIDNKLKFLRPSKDGTKTLPMETIVSINLFKNIIPDYANLTWGEKRKFIQEMRPKIIGYRIPTSGQSSVFTIEVKDVLPEQAADTIILPAEAVTLAGFDFDIDKLYLARYNYETNQETSTKIEYTEDNKTEKKALENRLLDSYFAILEDEKHFISILTPLDTATDLLRNTIVDDVRKLEARDKQHTWAGYELSPRYQSSVKSEYLGGSDGISSYAVSNVHHIMGQLVGLGINVDLGIGHNDPINAYTDLSKQTDKEKTGKEFVYITDWLNGLVNAHLDIAKDSYIYELNVNKDTHSIVNLLIRAGVGEKTFYFLSQPIIKDYTKEARLQAGEVKNVSGKPMNIIKKRWQNRMTDNDSTAKVKDRSQDKIWDKERLRKDINHKTDHNTEFYKRQLQILDEFNNINGSAYYLNEAVSVSRLDTPKYKNLVEIKTILNKINKVKFDGMINNFNKLFENTFLGTIFNNSIGLANEVFRNKTITGTTAFLRVHDVILEQLGKKYTADAVLINNIADELFSIIVSRFFVNQTMGLGLSQEGYEQFIFGENSTANKLNEIKLGNLFPDIKDYRLIKSLKPNFEKSSENMPDMILSYNTQVKEKWDKDDHTSSWGDLFTHENPKVREFGRELMINSFISSGFKRNIYSYFQYVPVTYMKDIGYNEFIIEQLKIMNNTEVGTDALLNYLDDFYKHNWENDNIVPKVLWGNTVDRIKLSDDRTQDDANAIAIFKMDKAQGKISKDNKIIELLTGWTNEVGGEPMFRPYVKMESAGKMQLYKYQGYVLKGTDVQPVYTITNKLGFYHKGSTFKEYGYSDSVFEENKVNIPEETRLNLLPENLHNIGSSNKYLGFIAIDAFINSSIGQDISQVKDIEFEQLEQEFTEKSILQEIKPDATQTSMFDIPKYSGMVVDVTQNTEQNREELSKKYKHCIGLNRK